MGSVWSGPDARADVGSISSRSTGFGLKVPGRATGGGGAVAAAHLAAVFGACERRE